MKKFVSVIILFALASTLGACGNAESSKESGTSQISISSGDYVTSDIEVSSNEEVSSSEQKTSSEASSSSEAQNYKENELSTSSGLVVKFKAEGASIDKITWQNKQIAKDGFVVGRCANRIANGKFTIDGTQYTADINSSPHSLHGGNGSGWNSWRGPFATATWTKVSQTASTITYSIHSNDGANGYPGNMDMTVKYTLSEEGALSIEYSATTDKATLCNPTNHLFIAINGNTSYDNIDLWINADKYTPLNNQIPTGDISSVTGTQFDYTTEKAFDKSKNYDDNLVLNGEGYRHVASLTGKTSYLKLNVYTDRPGLQLYKDGSGNICLETQMFPDAINHDNFEDPILRPGETFYSKTTYEFLAID